MERNPFGHSRGTEHNQTVVKQHRARQGCLAPPLPMHNHTGVYRKQLSRCLRTCGIHGWQGRQAKTLSQAREPRGEGKHGAMGAHGAARPRRPKEGRGPATRIVRDARSRTQSPPICPATSSTPLPEICCFPYRLFGLRQDPRLQSEGPTETVTDLLGLVCELRLRTCRSGTVRDEAPWICNL